MRAPSPTIGNAETLAVLNSNTATRANAARQFLRGLTSSSLVLSEDLERVSAQTRREVERCESNDELLTLLVQHSLLTQYQAQRLRAGKTLGLTLGNYRVLDRLGAGGMGVVFLAEHIQLRRLVAIKVLSCFDELDELPQQRFLNEMRAVAKLQHPNIVAAIDAGHDIPDDPNSPSLYYFVMEYVPGEDLEVQVEKRGPLAPAQACRVVYQVACALAEAHAHRLLHRDVKPSNIIVTPEGQAKLLDFGLARLPAHRLTAANAGFGSFDYLAPEQLENAATADARADIYGLASTLFWCLTGRAPFGNGRRTLAGAAARLTERPPSIRSFRPTLPAALDEVLARMLDPQPQNRLATARTVQQALLTFLEPQSSGHRFLSPCRGVCEQRVTLPDLEADRQTSRRVLVVDHDAELLSLFGQVFPEDEMQLDIADDETRALQAAQDNRCDLILLATEADTGGPELLRKLREVTTNPALKIITLSHALSPQDLAAFLLAGADDCLVKPVKGDQLRSQVRAAFRLQHVQDRSEVLHRFLVTVNADKARKLSDCAEALACCQAGFLQVLVEIMSRRGVESRSHLARMPRYCRLLAEEAAELPTFAGRIDATFLDALDTSAVLHDTGKLFTTPPEPQLGVCQ